MEFRVLGPVEVSLGSRVLDAGHARQRAVLAVLLLDLGRVVPADRLIDRVWGEDPPAAVRNALYGYIARLRAIIAGAADAGVTLSRRQSGYLLQADPGQLDLHRFRSLADQAAATASSDETAEQLLRQALALWHGPALAGLDSPWLNAMRDTLELERHAAALDLNDVRLRRGQHSAVAAELVGQSTTAPADERLIGQLMLALYRCGRQADALRWFEQTRRYLADELGTGPARQLQELHQQILQADPALAASAWAATSERAPTVPRELPGDVAAFTGRGAELAVLDELLLGAATTTAAVISAVSGAAGVGKTALAVHWAHHAAPRFPDGQLFVNLRGYDPDQPVSADDALAQFLRSLGVHGQDIPADEAERAARYRSLLAGKRTLVVLDNAATVEQVRPLLPGHPGCRIVVTSRDSFGGLVARDGAQRLDLDLLPLDDAVALLRQLIGERADAEPDAATELAQQCARLPLALRVAAEMAAARPDVPLADLVAELSNHQRRLDLLSAGADPRTAIRAVFSWSYHHLHTHAARTFRLSGLHPGPDFDPYAAAALTHSTVEQARSDLASLVRVHLVHATTPGRYGMHDLLSAYAREQATAADTDTSRQLALTGLFDYYLSTAAAATDLLYPAEAGQRPRVGPSVARMPDMPGEADARAWLDAEQRVLVSAAIRAAETGCSGHAIKLAATLFRYLDVGGYYSDAEAIHEHARVAALKSRDRAAEAEALTNLGASAWRQGRDGHAATLYERAIALCRGAGDRVGEARALANIGLVDRRQGRYQQASYHYGQALQIYREIGDVLAQARQLSALGTAETQLGGYGEAAVHFREALAICQQIGDQAGEATALTNLGFVCHRQGDYQQARTRQQEALALFRQTGHRSGQAHALSNIGVVDQQQGHYEQATDHLLEALVLFREIGDRGGEAETLNDLGFALLASGRPGEATDRHGSALALASEMGDTYQKGRAHDGLGRACNALGDAELAREHWLDALRLYSDLGVPEAEQVSELLVALNSGGSPGA